MRSVFYRLLLAATLAALSGCAKPTAPTPTPTAPTAPAAPAAGGATKAEPDAAQTGSGSDILVAYYSRTGHTKAIADEIAKQTGGKLVEIKTVKPYPEDYNKCCDVAKVELRQHARPAVSTKIDDMARYKTVFIGFPIWWSDAPMAVLTFLESYDLAGKTVIPFCTYDSSGVGNSTKSVTKSAKGATIGKGFDTTSKKSDSAAPAVDTWLDGLNLKPAAAAPDAKRDAAKK